jgi:2-alkenal reductase
VSSDSHPEHPRRQTRWRCGLLLPALLVVTGCGGSLVGQADPTPSPPPPTPTSVARLSTGEGVVPANPAPGPAPAGGGTPIVAPFGVVEVVQRVSPAVVTVVNEQQAGGLGRRQTLEAGRGTGFIIDADGHIVTNWHVVNGGDRFEVIFANGEKRPADLVGSDPLSDLAVVRVADGVPATVPFGDSEALLVGQPVLAIGSPLGEFTNTVTDGIVSSLGRDLTNSPGQGDAAYSNLIQHNAAINPGNSGGPLFDLAGRVIGVNTLGIPESGQIPVQGLFFAIPANTVAEITAQLIESGRVAYPFLGIGRTDITPQLASEFDLPIDHGAYVNQVEPGTPAAAAGIAPGDIILAIGGQAIDSRTSFSEALFNYRPGDAVPVRVLRGGDELDLNVTLGERTD